MIRQQGATKLFFCVLICVVVPFSWADGRQFFLEDRSHTRIGVFAGTLDPTHDNHTSIVEAAIRQERLHVSYVMANLASPHKPEATPYEIRKEMAMAAFEHLPHARFPDAALEQAYSGWDILLVIKELMRRFPQADIYHVLGSDSITRYGSDFEARFNHRNDDFVRRYKMVVNIREKGDERLLPKSYGLVEVIPLHTNNDSLSSTVIRNAVRSGKKPDGVNPKVFEVMKRERLYLPKVSSGKCVRATGKKPQ
ncbi:MAG: hypothetical protein KDD61_03775 [Bdellovibrionales bacterium]|nr:hypothetical protein [Bdellovibrionales bacterium]